MLKYLLLLVFALQGVLVFLKFRHFSCELKETGSLGATESEV